MAQTKRKRRSKHRGNAAGTIEARGRTGRPPTAEERKKTEKLDKAKVREARLNKPPTWRSSLNRAMLASGFMFVLLLFTSKFKIVPSAIFAVLAMAIYVPSGYYLENFLYKRRMRKQAQTR
jgi:Flp pilus assembly protein TadB